MKTRKMDMHLHTVHSMDGKQGVMDLCKRAAALGLEEICITDHIEPGHPTPGVDSPPDFPIWLEDIAAAKKAFPQMDIRIGLEIGDNAPIRPSIYETLEKLPLDFRLLSLHLVKGLDPYEAVYFEGRTQKQAYSAYAEAKAESILNFADYDAVAHIGYVGKFAPYAPEKRALTYEYAPDAFDTMFRFMANNGKALEINASGLRQTTAPIPGGDLIRRFLDLGGEFFTLGSDAHTTQDVYGHVEEAKALLKAQGAKWQVGFKERVMQVYCI